MTESTVDFLVVYQGGEDEEETNSAEWYWQGRSDNEKVVTRGEGHPSYSNALRAAKGAHPNVPVFKLVDGERVPVGVHSTDRYSEIKAMLGIPDSEPIFILRGQDKAAADGIEEYAYFGRDRKAEADPDSDEIEPWFEEIMEEVGKFRQWAKDNPDSMKVPD